MNEVKDGEFMENIGAKKIGIIAGVDASGPTVMKALRLGGHGPVTEYRARHLKRWCRERPNMQWNIDFVKIGDEVSMGRRTGKAVESLSVVDDHSRLSLVADATTGATTDHVLEVLEALMETYGKPEIIHSDHGSQWYATCSGDCRFDRWCEERGIVHTMAPIREPERNGKVERYHGSIRREADLPAVGTVDEYLGHLERYRTFYNEVRPHCALGYRTPSEVYDKTLLPRGSDVDGLIDEALEEPRFEWIPV